MKVKQMTKDNWANSESNKTMTTAVVVNCAVAVIAAWITFMTTMLMCLTQSVPPISNQPQFSVLSHLTLNYFISHSFT